MAWLPDKDEAVPDSHRTPQQYQGPVLSQLGQMGELGLGPNPFGQHQEATTGSMELSNRSSKVPPCLITQVELDFLPVGALARHLRGEHQECSIPRTVPKSQLQQDKLWENSSS